MEPVDPTDLRIGARVKARRFAAGLSLEALAARSGVSRAAISRIERGEASPTAQLLGRLCAGLGIDLAWLFQVEADAPAPLARRADQPVWTDPGTGYTRRNLTPAGSTSPVRMIDVTLPPGARVIFDLPAADRVVDQQIYLLEGELERSLGEETWRLAPGDCLHIRLTGGSTFHNPGRVPARYVLALALVEAG
ncbi:MAG: helix-turn-helix transcriptional regulator [Methylobacteriaceae bacterium]|nr:helix-turn-helix transcriptional regulator [Methylobacteriaceae bacterium]